MTFDIWANGKVGSAQNVALPDYPASAGPIQAKQMEARADHYRSVAKRLRQELAAVEDAMVTALARGDARAVAVKRLEQMSGTMTEGALASSYAAARRGR